MTNHKLARSNGANSLSSASSSSSQNSNASTAPTLLKSYSNNFNSPRPSPQDQNQKGALRKVQSWGAITNGSAQLGMKKWKAKMMLDPKNVSNKGRLRKKMGRPTKEMVAAREGLYWEDLAQNENIGIEGVNELDIEDANPANLRLRCVYFDKVAGSGFSLGQVLNDVLEGRNPNVTNIHTWYLIDNGTVLEDEAGECEYKYLLQMSGHVREIDNMDAMLGELLEYFTTEEPQLTVYTVTDGPCKIEEL